MPHATDTGSVPAAIGMHRIRAPLPRVFAGAHGAAGAGPGASAGSATCAATAPDESAVSRPGRPPTARSRRPSGRAEGTAVSALTITPPLAEAAPRPAHATLPPAPAGREPHLRGRCARPPRRPTASLAPPRRRSSPPRCLEAVSRPSARANARRWRRIPPARDSVPGPAPPSRRHAPGWNARGEPAAARRPRDR